MDVTIKDFADNSHVIEVGKDDTTETMRQKVATAMGLPEDGFCMSFRDEAMGAGSDMTQLSAGDTIILTKTQKQEAIAELHALGETDITAEKLASVRDPEVACLLLQAEVATVIPDDFLSGTSLTRLDLSAESIVTHIGDWFLADCTSLTSINLSGLSNVMQVGVSFLANCKSLTALDLSPLSNVTKVEDRFLFCCISLTTIDLSALSNVTRIDDSFLSMCTSLTSIDLSPLTNVTQVGAWFLAHCKNLSSLDLSPLNNVTQIDHNFLNGCQSLTTIDLSPLSNVTSISLFILTNTTQFAAYCTSLTSIYLSGCSSVVSNEVRNGELSKLVVEARPKRSRDESPEQSQKRRRHAQ